MFDLDRAIAEWRRQMTAGGVKAPGVLDELESHLRADVDQQLRSGTTAERGFELAVQRIGQATALRAEFSKAGRSADERKRAFLAIYAIVFPVLYALISVYGMFDLEMTIIERLLGFAAIALTGLFIGSIPHAHHLLPTIRNRKRRQMIQIGSHVAWMLGGAVFLNLIVPQLCLTQGQLVVAVLWLMMPVAAIGSFAYGLGEAARQRTETTAL